MERLYLPTSMEGKYNLELAIYMKTQSGIRASVDALCRDGADITCV